MPERGRCFSIKKATLSGPDSGRGKVCGNCEKFNGGRRGTERQMRHLRGHGLAELGQVTSGSAMHGLGLGDRKVEFQVIGED